VTRGDARTIVLVPLYTDPGPAWEALRTIAASVPGASLLVIANANSGPDAAPRAEYAAGIAALRDAGIAVAGYVSTAWGGRSAASVRADVRAWRAWYGVDAIFFDETATDAKHAPLYASYAAEARRAGVALTVGNPGTTIDDAFDGLFDAFVVHENVGYPESAWYAAPSPFGRDALGVIARCVPFDADALSAIAGRARFVFATDAERTRDYQSLPTYFAELLSVSAE
jgi:hypothetical protein